MDKEVNKIYNDLIDFSLEAGSAPVCMIAAYCLVNKLYPGEWGEIKKQLSVENIKNELQQLKKEASK